MPTYNTPEIAKGVYAVGAKDWNRQVFDAFIPTPKGTSYNSYLVKGINKTALIDTVARGFENELIAKIAQLTDLSMLDYLIMNHAEPDHGAAIPLILKSSNATLITSEKGASMAGRFYGVPPERIRTVKDGDTIDLGGRTLRFVEAPWTHWPETMWTYLVEDRLLFSCDFFGAHSAHGIYADDVDDIIHLAKSYFAEIMMPFRAFAKRAIDKINSLEIAMIAPSHGPVYKNPNRIIDDYRRWVAGVTRPKAIIAYVTMWNSTEMLAKAMYEALLSCDVEVKIYNLSLDGLDNLAADIVDSRAIVVGTPTVLSSIHPVASNALNIIRVLKPPLKYGAILTSYGWGKGAVKAAIEFFDSAKIEMVGVIEVNGPPLDDDFQKIAELAHLLASKITKDS
jgi:flavorubredoxin